MTITQVQSNDISKNVLPKKQLYLTRACLKNINGLFLGKLSQKALSTLPSEFTHSPPIFKTYDNV